MGSILGAEPTEEEKQELESMLSDTPSDAKTTSLTVDPETGKPLDVLNALANQQRLSEKTPSIPSHDSRDLDAEAQKQNYAHYLSRLQDYRVQQQLRNPTTTTAVLGQSQPIVESFAIPSAGSRRSPALGSHKKPATSAQLLQPKSQTPRMPTIG